MNKFLSKLCLLFLSLLILSITIDLSVFAQSTGATSGQTLGVKQDSGLVITYSGQLVGQSGQLMDPILSTGVNPQNTGINTANSIGQRQTGQVSNISQNRTTFSRTSIPTPAGTRSQTATSELIISEVFFDGSNEWVEIYNLSSMQFSGDIIISGASAAPKTISNLVISGLDTKIFADTNIDSILDTSSVFQTNMGFSISDSSNMNIDLIYSGIVLDSFNVTAAIVNALANKISFHRFIDTRNIVASDITHTDNTTSGYIANPGMIYDEISPPIDPKLKITEIYFDGDDERFEISNIDGLHDFSGNLTIAGDLDLNISTQISAGDSIVYANSIYAMFQTGQNIQIIPILSGGVGEINFDTGAINLNLVRSGQTLDTFFADETQVQYYTNADTSFEKIGGLSISPSLRTTTVVGLASDRYYNTNWGIAANPTRYYTTGENLIDVTQARVPVSHTEPLPIDCDDFRDDSTANISEVYYGNNIYAPYIEIRAQENIYDTYSYIKLEGTALSGIVAFSTESSAFSNIDMERNKRILISSSDSRYNEGREAVSDPNFTLNSTGGRLTLYGWDDWGGPNGDGGWEILDIVYLASQVNGNAGNSLYIGSNTNQCADIFDYQNKFSPGLTIGQSQFIDITPDPIIQYIHVGGGGSCAAKTSTKFDTADDLLGEVQIATIKYFGNLQILKLKNKTNIDIDLRDYRLQNLDGTTQTIKGNTLFAKSSMSFVGNYNLPTKQDYCINLLKTKNTANNKNQVVDRYCRNSISKASQIDQDRILDQLGFWIDKTDQSDQTEDKDDLDQNDKEISNPLQTNTVKIIDIDYNPSGSDKDNESITLLLLTGGQIDLSDYILQYIKDGKSTHKNINGILTQGGQQIFKGDFTLPNSTKDKLPVTVNLIRQYKNINSSKNTIVDTYIYNPNKIKQIPDGDYKVISVIDGDTVKIAYAGQTFNIRFAGMDAPESSTLRCGKVECFGTEAKQYLKSLLENQTIRFESSIETQKDSFDRFVGYIFLKGENINLDLIQKGYAREYSYKGRSYKYSKQFKSAQKYAKSSKLGLWAASSCGGLRMCPVQETQDNIYANFVLNIQNIMYDPLGLDKNNETIQISMPILASKNKTNIDLADGFYLKINNSKKYLKDYGTISPGQTKILKGTFGFPNTKKTTVSLFYDENKFDTYVYDPVLDKLLQDKLDKNLDTKVDSGLTLTSGLVNTSRLPLGASISIVSILPNPLGKDSLGEELGLLYSVDIKHAINLSDGFYLKIGDKKTYFKNKIKNNNYQLTSNQETLLRGNFGLPNKASCIEIGYENEIFDKFCYSDPNEGQKFIKSNGILESINVIDFGILNKSKLQNIGNQVCLTFGSQKFDCKNMPHSKLSIKKINQNKLYKDFFDKFENYLKSQRKIMYYDTDIKNYFSLLNEIEKAISEGKSELEFEGIKFKTSEFQRIYRLKYPQSTADFVQTKLSDFVPSKIRQKYGSLLEEYNQYLLKE